MTAPPVTRSSTTRHYLTLEEVRKLKSGAALEGKSLAQYVTDLLREAIEEKAGG